MAGAQQDREVNLANLLRACRLPDFTLNEPAVLTDELQMRYVLVLFLSFIESLT